MTLPLSHSILTPAPPVSTLHLITDLTAQKWANTTPTPTLNPTPRPSYSVPASLAAALALLLDAASSTTAARSSCSAHHQASAAPSTSSTPGPPARPTQSKRSTPSYTGYVALADSPACTLLSELLALYPDDKVIATTRDIPASTPWWLRAVLTPLPTLRWTVDYMNALYGEAGCYERHVEWVKEVVPAGRLAFVDVRDGWGPVCRALGRDVPVGVESLWVNDGKAIEAFAEREVMQGVVAWVKIFEVFGMSVLIGTWGWRWMLRT